MEENGKEVIVRDSTECRNLTAREFWKKPEIPLVLVVKGAIDPINAFLRGESGYNGKRRDGRVARHAPERGARLVQDRFKYVFIL